MRLSRNDKQHSNQMRRSSEDIDLQAIAYSMDALIPGLYIWFSSIRIRIGGSLSEDNYPGTIQSPIGIGLVLPGYRIYSTDRYESADYLDS
jgi:hypothetical protein